jgi:hypothetical protein
MNRFLPKQYIILYLCYNAVGFYAPNYVSVTGILSICTDYGAKSGSNFSIRTEFGASLH